MRSDLAICLGLLGALSGSCFPAYDLPPATPLPDGGFLSPCGELIEAGGAPLDLDVTAERNLAAVLAHAADGLLLTLVDLAAPRVLESIAAPTEASRARFFDHGARLVLVGDRTLVFYQVDGGSLRQDGVLALAIDPVDADASGSSLIAVDHALERAWLVRRGSRSLDVIDLTARQATQLPLVARARTLAVAEGGNRLAVGLANEPALLVLAPATGRVLARVLLAGAPSALAFDDRGDRLFVASAEQTSVEIIDLLTFEIVAQVSYAAEPDPAQSDLPAALAFEPMRARLHVTNAQENSVAVLDASQPASARLLGLLPTARAPMAVAATGQQVMVLNAGSPSAAERAVLQVMNAPVAVQLALGTATVRRNLNR